jgi:hypothetical protein
MNKILTQNNLGVVAHDAGGAEILASYLLQNQFKQVRFALSGPAKRIFKEKLGDVRILPTLNVIEESDWVLTGTGWQTDFEWHAIRSARAVGKHVVTFLDHWVNYKPRFQREGETCYPNEIWIGDEYAEKLARIEFPSVALRLIENPCYKDFVNDVQRQQMACPPRRSIGKKILFVCENINSDGFHQDDAIRYFMSNLDALREEIDTILIRPHPAEHIDKYTWVEEVYGKNIALSEGGTLAKDVAVSDIVVGCSTMAMALAVKAGRRVISCIPNERYPFTLPFEQIENLSDLIKIDKY